MTPRDFDRKEVRAINAKETVTITVRQTITTSIKIEKSTETKEHDDVSVIVVLVPRGWPTQKPSSCLYCNMPKAARQGRLFSFFEQEKPVLVRITSEGPSRENRLEETI